MNKVLEYNVTGQSIELSSSAMLVSGTVNEYTARFSFDADWDGYQRIAVFAVDGVEREQLLTDDVCDVPWEVLLPGARLKVGVYGTRDGKRLPTIWTTHRQYINDGAGPTDEAADPSPVLAEQILQRMGDLGDLKTEDKASLVAAINEVKETGGGGGTSDHSKLKNRDAADQHPMSAITGLEAALDGKQAAGNYLTDKHLDATLTVEGKAADAKAVGDALSTLSEEIANLGGGADVSVEPAEDDIPKVFFGGALQQTKDAAVVPFRYISKTQDISGYAEIKAQGNSSMSYPKKNQTVKLFKDADCTEKLKVDFKGWGMQNKHVYKANWIDLSHARNVVSARLWADVVKSRSNYAELPELLRTSPNQGAVDGFPVKVYAAGVYQGRYTLNIPKDKWAFNMDDTLDNHCVLCGENYASGCFRAAASINGSDWTDEIHNTVPESIKTRWNEVISFVMNSTDDEFKMNLGQYFDIQSLIDYHLFGLQSCSLDAYGKNQIYMTYDGQKWLASMYDMDSTWGLYWNGSKFVSTDYARTSYEDFASTQSSGEGNLLFIRLEQLFWEELQTRWAELKNGALSIENIINRFERFTDIASAELVEEDYASTTGGGKFTGIPSQTTNNIQQIRSFALARQAWTNEYVMALTPGVEVPCEGITLDAETLTFTAEGEQTITATATPDGCTDSVVWISSNPSVASISGDGAVCTVTAVANGNATITVTCGNYSASCSVSVSGIVEPVPCTGITLDKTALRFSALNETQTITATVTPADTTDNIVWNSDNHSVATVADGVVKVVGYGTAIITATCGNHSASCKVKADRITISDEGLVYYLPSETVFTGENYIDTGVKLFETNKDFGIVIDFTGGGGLTTNGLIFHCLKENSPYPGFQIEVSNNGYQAVAYGKYHSLGLAMNSTDRIRVAVSKNANENTYTIKCSNGKNGVLTPTSVTTFDQTALLGCYQTNSGTTGRFWKGTIHECKIYERQLTEDEMSGYVS